MHPGSLSLETSARHQFDARIRALESDVLNMASKSEALLARAVKCLIDHDVAGARETMAQDDDIDQLDLQIERDCLQCLALDSPLASDLRKIGTIIKIITDLERIGDLAVDVAKIAVRIDQEMGETDYVDLPRMDATARLMLREAVQAFVRGDASDLDTIVRLEEEVDSLHRQLRGQIHDYMRNRPDQVVAASWMLLAIHHIERAADHALNIADRVQFMVTGKLSELSPSHRAEAS